MQDDEEKVMKGVMIVALNIFLLGYLFSLCVGCTLNVVITQSDASKDAVDAEPKNDPKCDINLETPLGVI